MKEIKFVIETKYGSYSDALYLSDEQVDILSEEQIEEMKQERVKNYVQLVENPPILNE